MKLVNIQNDLYLGNQNPLHVENGTKPFEFRGKLQEN